MAVPKPYLRLIESQRGATTLEYLLGGLGLVLLCVWIWSLFRGDVSEAAHLEGDEIEAIASGRWGGGGGGPLDGPRELDEEDLLTSADPLGGDGSDLGHPFLPLGAPGNGTIPQNGGPPRRPWRGRDDVNLAPPTLIEEPGAGDPPAFVAPNADARRGDPVPGANEGDRAAGAGLDTEDDPGPAAEVEEATGADDGDEVDGAADDDPRDPEALPRDPLDRGDLDRGDLEGGGDLPPGGGSTSPPMAGPGLGPLLTLPGQPSVQIERDSRWEDWIWDRSAERYWRVGDDELPEGASWIYTERYPDVFVMTTADRRHYRGHRQTITAPDGSPQDVFVATDYSVFDENHLVTSSHDAPAGQGYVVAYFDESGGLVGLRDATTISLPSE